ncbi:M23 family metallopeptidase [Microbacterium ginsengisoli]|nr:M23 family metallopeptidase [Microbacteriaceae bacterium K1510]
MTDNDISPTPESGETARAPATRRSTREGARLAAEAAKGKVKQVASAVRPTSSAPRRKGAAGPVRSVVILTMVGGLVATVALPAYGAFSSGDGTQTVQQLAAENAQSLVIASDASQSSITRDSYSATTADELAKKKAAEAAAARAKSASVVSRVASVNLSLVAPGSGIVRWPVDMAGTRVGDGFLSRGGTHMGVDLLNAQGTPIFAAAAGTVRVAAAGNYYYGYGHAIVIDSVINGQQVSTLYGHLEDGGVLVQPGQQVQVGQIIGLMGSTGQSTANHLHFEVKINGNYVDPYAWLQQNAG